jgi:hypothetical protein
MTDHDTAIDPKLFPYVFDSVSPTSAVRGVEARRGRAFFPKVGTTFRETVAGVGDARAV